MPKSLVTSAVFIICLLLVPNWAYPQGIDVRLTVAESINIDPSANFQVTPRSFCITEDRLFLFSDYKAGKIKLFSKEGQSLRFISEIGRNGKEQGERFSDPKLCIYGKGQGTLGVIDYKDRETVIFRRDGKIDFEHLRNVSCERLGYEIKFSQDGEQLVVSGFVTAPGGESYGLYAINIRNGRLNYLLENYKKYGLQSVEEYKEKYHNQQIIPAIGTIGFIDIASDYLYFAWEGALKIIKIHLPSKESETFGHETSYYKEQKPDGVKLAKSYRIKNFAQTWKDQEKMAYVKRIFASDRHVFLIYEVGKGTKRESKFRMQIYTANKKFLTDISMHGKNGHHPGQYMWLDKDLYHLYVISKESEQDFRNITLLKYKIDFKGGNVESR